MTRRHPSLQTAVPMSVLRLLFGTQSQFVCCEKRCCCCSRTFGRQENHYRTGNRLPQHHRKHCPPTWCTPRCIDNILARNAMLFRKRAMSNSRSVSRTHVRINQLNAARTWVRGQLDALDDIVASIERHRQQAIEGSPDVKVLQHFICYQMNDEAGMRVAVDTQKVLLPSQRRLRRPIERQRIRLEWKLLGSAPGTI